MNMSERGSSVLEFVLVLFILLVLAYGIWAILSGNGLDLTSFIQCDQSKNIFGCGG